MKRFSMRAVATWPIVLYQKTLSFDHGPMRGFYPHGYCPYHPSCSEYCRQAILKYGIAWGLGKGVWRILRCNPWSHGGVDVP